MNTRSANTRKQNPTHLYKVSEATKQQLVNTPPELLPAEPLKATLTNIKSTDSFTRQLTQTNSTLALDCIESEIYSTITHLEAERTKQSRAINTMRSELSGLHSYPHFCTLNHT